MSPKETPKSTNRGSSAQAGDRSRRQEEARRAKAEVEAHAGRRRPIWWVVGGSALIVVAVILGLSLSGGSKSPNRTASSTTTGPTASTTAAPSGTVATTGSGQPTTGITLSTSPPPWPIPADATPYIAAAGLHAQGGETLQVHYHAHVDIIDHGTPVSVPADIGILIHNGQATGLTSLHTHDTSGIVHIESATNAPYSLGQVFTEWGVRLATGQVGSLVTGNGNVLRVYVNGSTFTGDPATIVLRPHQEIAFWFGSISATPQVPSSYTFPAGD